MSGGQQMMVGSGQPGGVRQLSIGEATALGDVTLYPDGSTNQSTQPYWWLFPSIDLSIMRITLTKVSGVVNITPTSANPIGAGAAFTLTGPGSAVYTIDVKNAANTVLHGTGTIQLANNL